MSLLVYTYQDLIDIKEKTLKMQRLLDQYRDQMRRLSDARDQYRKDSDHKTFITTFYWLIDDFAKLNEGPTKAEVEKENNRLKEEIRKAKESVSEMKDKLRVYEITMSQTIIEDDELMSLTKELMCEVCMDFYKDPRTLRCGHYFCSKCISLIMEMSDGTFPTCPVCRHPFEVGSLENFVVSSHVNRLLVHVSKLGKRITDFKLAKDFYDREDEI